MSIRSTVTDLSYYVKIVDCTIVTIKTKNNGSSLIQSFKSVV